MTDSITISKSSVNEILRWTDNFDYSLPADVKCKVSPSGRFCIFVLPNASIIAIDVICGTKILFKCEQLHKRCLDFQFLPFNDHHAYLFQEIQVNDTIWAVSIHNVELEYTTQTIQISEPIPFVDYSTGYCHKYCSSCSFNNNMLAVVVNKMHRFADRSLDTLQCYILKYGEDKQWTRLRCLDFDRQFLVNSTQFSNSPNDYYYLSYLTVYQNKLYGFLYLLRARFYFEVFDQWNNLHQIDLVTSNHTVIKARNELKGVEFQNCSSTSESNENLHLKDYKWNRDILFIWWAFKSWNKPDPQNLVIDRHQMNYLACFNLNTLLWHPIQLPIMYPHFYCNILRLQMTNENVLIVHDFNKFRDKKLVCTSYVSIPIGTPKTLTCLSWLKIASSGFKLKYLQPYLNIL